jgi:hypothetical protein
MAEVANLAALRYLIFSGAKDSISFDEFLTNFNIASRATPMSEEVKKSTFFSHFDGKALTYLYQNPDLLEKPFEEAVNILRNHFVGIKTFNPAKIAGMTQQPNESVHDFLRRMKEVVYPLTEVKVNTEGMTADELAIVRVQKEARLAQAQEFIKPHFLNGLKRELHPQLPMVFRMSLKDMVKELSRWESFQRELPIPERRSYVGMINNGEPEGQELRNSSVTKSRDQEEEERRNQMFADFANWWNNQHRSSAETFQDWRNQVDTIHRRNGKKFKRPNQRPNYNQQNDQSYQQASITRQHINNVAVNPPEASATPAFSPHSMQKAAEILTSLNPAQPNTGLIPNSPMQQSMPIQTGYPTSVPTQYNSNPATSAWNNYQSQPPWRDFRQNNGEYRGPQTFRGNFYPSRNNYSNDSNNRFGGNHNGFGGNPGYGNSNNYRNFNNRPRYSETQTNDRFCTYCQRHRHTIEYCFDRKRDEMQKNLQHNGPQSTGQSVSNQSAPRNNPSTAQVHFAEDQPSKNGSGRPTAQR